VPEKYQFTTFLQARLKESYYDDNELGFGIHKNGLATLGVSHSGILSIDEAKLITGKLTYKFADCVFPVLNEVQRSLLSSVYDEKEIMSAPHKIYSYSLIKGICPEWDYNSTDEILQKHPHVIDALTDWIIDHTTMGNCQIFMGMAAVLCLGDPDEETDNILKFILYLQTCMKTSQRLHSLLWSLRKRIQNIRNNIKNSNYKTLKENNELICELNDNLSKIKVFDELLRNETDEMTSLWDKIHFEDSRFKERISENFRDEVEKSENREATIQQLTEELNVLTSEVENRLELIMTRDNMRLNIILLILTVISVLGVAEVVGFTEEQWKVVVVVLLPFVFLTVFYMRNFLKNFNKRDKKTNK
jgi:hypothetical protein